MKEPPGLSALPHYPAPADDNERLLELQYRWLTAGDRAAWKELWILASEIAGRMVRNICRRRRIRLSRFDREDIVSAAVVYILRRYETRSGWYVKGKYPLQIWHAVRHAMDYRTKAESLVDYVSPEELTRIQR